MRPRRESILSKEIGCVEENECDVEYLISRDTPRTLRDVTVQKTRSTTMRRLPPLQFNNLIGDGTGEPVQRQNVQNQPLSHVAAITSRATV